MRIAFLGTGDFAVPSLEALVADGHRVLLVVSQPDRPAGRGRRVAPTAVHAAAERLGLPHMQTDDVNRDVAAAALADAEIGVVIAFGQKLGPALLRALPHGFINVHASLLPRYRGAAPYQWAVLNGDATTGVTVFQLDERWDAGPIWRQLETPIGATETAGELHDRLAPLGAEALRATLADLTAGALRPVAQDVARASRAPKLSKLDGYVDWHAPAPACVARIHGLWPWPSAACLLNRGDAAPQERIQLARATLAPGAPRGAAGEFDDELCVCAGNGRVRLLEVKPAGGNCMRFEDFSRGRRLAAGARLLRVTGE